VLDKVFTINDKVIHASNLARHSRMSDGIRGLSLLPFPERNPGTFHLRFPLASQDPEALADSSFPFLLISDSDPMGTV
jgi:hypothetical protein